MSEFLQFLAGVLGNTPDKADSYQELEDGRWSVGNKVYPVARPVRGDIIKLASTKDKGDGE